MISTFTSPLKVEKSPKGGGGSELICGLVVFTRNLIIFNEEYLENCANIFALRKLDATPTIIVHVGLVAKYNNNNIIYVRTS